jgi:hypothetical protein
MFFSRLGERHWLLAESLIAIGVSAAGALLHRYVSTDGFAFV